LGDGRLFVPIPGFIDGVPVERFITEDAYIHRGIGTTAIVTFGDKEIGPSGVIIDVQTG